MLGHELTHALWTLLFGGRATGMRVSDRGGQVRVTKTNVWIDLSPYFFPFYTMLVLGVYAVAGRFADLSVYRPFWMGLIGLTWGFHLTFTLSLALHQTDVQEHGRLFSYALIFAVNALGVGIGVRLARRPRGGRRITGVAEATARLYAAIPALVRRCDSPPRSLRTRRPRAADRRP